MDAPREVPQHTVRQPTGTPQLTSDRSSIGAVRRATAADSAAIAALSPGLAPPTASNDRALFVIDGDAGPVAAIDLAQAGDHISVEHLVAGDRDHGRTLLAFADVAARAIGMREIRLKPGAVPDELSRALGYRAGAKRVRNGPWQRANDYLEAVGVPLWRDGAASLTQTLYFRGVWAAVALLVGWAAFRRRCSAAAGHLGPYRRPRPALHPRRLVRDRRSAFWPWRRRGEQRSSARRGRWRSSRSARWIPTEPCPRSPDVDHLHRRYRD
jgi:hypothetical protein